jgi:hypothetical protein
VLATARGTQMRGSASREDKSLKCFDLALLKQAARLVLRCDRASLSCDDRFVETVEKQLVH